MKKSTKKVFAALAALAVSCSAIAFAACGTTDKPDNPDDGKVEAKISYQFVGNYDELMSWGMVYDFCANLTPDGVATITIYRNDEDITKIEGSWKEAADEDGVNVLTIRDGVNPDGKYELYSESDGSYIWKDYYFTFMGGYSRKIDLNGSSKITYEEEADWLKYVAERREGMDIPQLGGDSEEGGNGGQEEQKPSEEATEIAVFKKDSSSITFLSDGTGKVSVFGAMNRTFKWTYAGGTLSITALTMNEGTEQGSAVVEGNNITVTVNGGGTDYSVTFADCDLSKLA